MILERDPVIVIVPICSLYDQSEKLYPMEEVKKDKIKEEL
jgi:hypothetical protein